MINVNVFIVLWILLVNLDNLLFVFGDEEFCDATNQIDGCVKTGTISDDDSVRRIIERFAYWTRTVKYRIYFKFVLGTVATFICLILVDLFQSIFKSAHSVVENLTTATIHFLAFYRYCVLIVRHDKFVEIMNFLNAHSQFYSTSRYSRQLKLKNYKINFIFIGVSYFLAHFCSIFWFWFPLEERANGKVQFPKPQVVYLPIEMNDDNFYCVYSIVCFLIFVSSVLVVATSTLFYTYFIFIGVEFRILGQSYQNIIKVDERPYNFSCIVYEMKRNIKRHVELLEITKKFMNLTYGPLLIQLTLNGLMICFATFKMSKVESFFTSEFLATVSYTTYTLFDLFIYCYFGQEIASASLDISTEVYACNWNHLYFQRNHREKIKSLKNIIVLTMVQSQHPLVFKGAGIVTLSLSTYLKIIKTSYSLLTILLNHN